MTSFSENSLISFLIKAKRNTYAAKGVESESSRPSSHDLHFTEGDFLYIDSFLGGEKFSGEEAVFYKSSPLWAMNYSGRVISNEFSGDFLKLSLMNPPKEMPFRGPEFFSQDDYTYKNECSGEFEWFQGYEQIFYSKKFIYECFYHGGIVK